MRNLDYFLILSVSFSISVSPSYSGNTVAIEVLKISNEGIELSGESIAGKRKIRLTSHELAHVFQQNQTDLKFLRQKSVEVLVHKIARELESNNAERFTVCDGKLCIEVKASQ